VVALTHQQGDSYDDYVERVAENELARRVKLADLADNLANNERLPRTAEVAARMSRYERAIRRLSIASATNPKETHMVKLVVAYGAPEDPAAFDEYYAATHTPLVHRIPNLRRFEAGKILGTPDGSTPPYYLLAELWFDDLEALQASMASPEGAAAGNDLPNFASGGATLMIAEG
jgi:uncharacterized protein (TIGR02118 family)